MSFGDQLPTVFKIFIYHVTRWIALQIRLFSVVKLYIRRQISSFIPSNKFTKRLNVAVLSQFRCKLNKMRDIHEWMFTTIVQQVIY